MQKCYGTQHNTLWKCSTSSNRNVKQTWNTVAIRQQTISVAICTSAFIVKDDAYCTHKIMGLSGSCDPGRRPVMPWEPYEARITDVKLDGPHLHFTVTCSDTAWYLHCARHGLDKNIVSTTAPERAVLSVMSLGVALQTDESGASEAAETFIFLASISLAFAGHVVLFWLNSTCFEVGLIRTVIDKVTGSQRAA